VSLLERLGVRLPIVQAGMGGGLSGHRLAAAVADCATEEASSSRHQRPRSGDAAGGLA